MAAVLLTAGCGTGQPGLHALDAPYVATPQDVGVEMLVRAGVSGSDVVFDLGSGDGRLVIEAARQFGARGVGVEIDPKLVQDSNENAGRAGVGDRVRFVWQDLFTTDIREATVVTLYLGNDVNLRLRPKLLRELRSGTRVISHNFHMGEWEPDQMVRFREPGREHRLYLWRIPADVAGTWRLVLHAAGGDREGVLTLEQRFQRVQASLRIGDQALVVQQATLEGDRLRLRAESAGGALSLDGRVSGERVEGDASIQRGSDSTVVPWLATRERAPASMR